MARRTAARNGWAGIHELASNTRVLHLSAEAPRLRALPARTQVVVAPLKVRAANGAPARVLAFVPD